MTLLKRAPAITCYLLRSICLDRPDMFIWTLWMVICWHNWILEFITSRLEVMPGSLYRWGRSDGSKAILRNLCFCLFLIILFVRIFKESSYPQGLKELNLIMERLGLLFPVVCHKETVPLPFKSLKCLLGTKHFLSFE